MKETTLGVGHFTTDSGHIFAKYINNFHKGSDGHFEMPNFNKS